MAAYLEPIKVAIFVFPGLAFVLSLPFFIRQYRQFGRFLFRRGFILYSFVFYLLCAYFLVILPLPDREMVAQMTGPKWVLALGKPWLDLIHQTVFVWNQPATYLPAMKQSVFLEPIFNLILLFPLGVYLRYYFKMNIKRTFLISFMVSLFFEVTQLTGLFFIYPRPYRLFDVNDLIHNSLGGVLGYYCAPLLTFMLPTRAQLDESSYEKTTQVTLVRRFVATIIDWVIIEFVSALFLFGLKVAHVNQVPETLSLFSYTIKVFCYWIVLNYLLKGQTPGKRAVKIKIVPEVGERVPIHAFIIRYSFLYLLPSYALQIFGLLSEPLNHSDAQIQMMAFYTAIGLAIFLLLYASLFTMTILLRKRVLFYEKMSHTHVISCLTINKN